MTITSPATEPQARGERITVTLIPKAKGDLQRLQERTKLSTTDLANRAITLYEFFDDQIRTGHEMIARDIRTGKTNLVRFADAQAGAPAGKPASPRSAWYRRGQAGYERHPARHVRASRRRFHRPALAGRLLLLIRLTNPENKIAMSRNPAGKRQDLLNHSN
jgi:hypothetical protein